MIGLQAGGKFTFKFTSMLKDLYHPRNGFLVYMDKSFSSPKAVDFALTTLKCSTTDNFARRQAWELIKCFLVSVMNLEDEKLTLTNLFTHTR